MPRFYFDITDVHGYHRDDHGDDHGDDLGSFEEARQQCQIVLPDIARSELPDGELHIIACDVRDEADRLVYRGRLTYEGTRLRPELASCRSMHLATSSDGPSNLKSGIQDCRYRWVPMLLGVALKSRDEAGEPAGVLRLIIGGDGGYEGWRVTRSHPKISIDARSRDTAI